MSELSKYRVQVFGASVDTAAENKKFSEQFGYNFPLLSDPDKSYAKALGVLNPGNGFPHRWTYIIDEEGVIREIDKMVKPAQHGKDLAAHLEKLGIPRK
jgi:thioredoxin-dependent peroxiredoxin